jgi:hypothetical protein
MSAQSIFSEEVLAKHRCRLDLKKLGNASPSDLSTIKSRSRLVETLRAQIEDLDGQIAASRNMDHIWRLRESQERLREIIRTIFPLIRDYVAS